MNLPKRWIAVPRPPDRSKGQSPEHDPGKDEPTFSVLNTDKICGIKPTPWFPGSSWTKGASKRSISVAGSSIIFGFSWA